MTQAMTQVAQKHQLELTKISEKDDEAKDSSLDEMQKYAMTQTTKKIDRKRVAVKK